MHIIQNLFTTTNNQKPNENRRKKRFDFTCGAADASSQKDSSEDNKKDVNSMLQQINNQYNMFTIKACGITGRSLLQTVDTAFLPMRDLGEITVKYFDTRRFLGRGGKIRLFLRAKHIKHTYEALELTKETEQDIMELQKSLIESGGSPTGQLPILIHDNKTFCETTAILRYLAKRIGEYGSNNEKDYIADMITDKLAYWTDDLMVAISEADTSEDLPTSGSIYLKARATYLTLFEKLLEIAGSSSFTACPINTKCPSWFACALVATLFDDIQIISMLKVKNQVQLNEFSKLQKLYDEVMDLPLIKELCLEKEIVRLSEEDPNWYDKINKTTNNMKFDSSQDNTTASSCDGYIKKEEIEYDIPMTRRNYLPVTMTPAQAAWIEQTSYLQGIPRNISGIQGMQNIVPPIPGMSPIQGISQMQQNEQNTVSVLTPSPSWQRRKNLPSCNSVPMHINHSKEQRQNLWSEQQNSYYSNYSQSQSGT